jgi:hypothetical protein
MDPDFRPRTRLWWGILNLFASASVEGIRRHATRADNFEWVLILDVDDQAFAHWEGTPVRIMMVLLGVVVDE